MMREKLYKILDKNGYSCNGGVCEWYLPEKGKNNTWTPGKWMPKIKGKLVPCQNGYHLCRENNILDWLGESIFEAEYRGYVLENTDKVIVREVRLLRKCENWNKRTDRLFACWCIRDTPLFDGGTVWNLLTDERSRNAVEIVERFVNGNATKEELAAARDAAEAVVRIAMGVAASAAEWDAKWVAEWAAAEAAVIVAVGTVAGAVASTVAKATVEAAIAYAAAREREDDDVSHVVRDDVKKLQTKELLRILNA